AASSHRRMDMGSITTDEDTVSAIGCRLLHADLECIAKHHGGRQVLEAGNLSNRIRRVGYDAVAVAGNRNDEGHAAATLKEGVRRMGLDGAAGAGHRTDGRRGAAATKEGVRRRGRLRPCRKLDVGYAPRPLVHVTGEIDTGGLSRGAVRTIRAEYIVETRDAL